MWTYYILGEAAIIGGLILLARKMELRLTRVIPWALFISPFCLWSASRLEGIVPGLGLILPLFLSFILAVFVSVLLILVIFSRDPERVSPAESGSILSPADGKIIYIESLEDGRFPISVKKGKNIPLTEFTGESFPLERGFQIGIMMSFLDVHINRAPIAGKVARIKRVPGVFHSLKHMDSLLENERVFSIIDGPGIRVGLVQIASRLVRRIVPFIKEGEVVRQGERIGMIRFGSQVDLLIPNRADLLMASSVGDYVKAGVSLIARYGSKNLADSKE